MRVLLSLAAVLMLGAASVSAQSGPTVPPLNPVPDITSLISRLSLDRYKATIKGLTQFGDRRQGTERNRKAVDWIEAQLKSYGCPTERVKYAYNTPPPAPRPAGAPAAAAQQPPSGGVPRISGGGRPRGQRAATGVNNDPLKQPDEKLRALNAEPATDGHDRLATELGLLCRRELLQLRRSLPLDDVARPARDLATRALRPGRDDDAWLAVNNAAFHWHPDQAGWTRSDLDTRVAEAWFDPEGFLLHEEGGRLAGFCWTKVHADHDPPLGEIYVIAVHPDFQGRGLGRALAVAGLDHLAGRGLPVAMLYVEADNEPALAVYRSLGFAVHHRHRWYEGPTRPPQ